MIEGDLAEIEAWLEAHPWPSRASRTNQPMFQIKPDHYELRLNGREIAGWDCPSIVEFPEENP